MAYMSKKCSTTGNKDDDMALAREKGIDESTEEVKPIGDVIGFSGKRTHRRNHYKAFNVDGITYKLEDTVLLVPDSEGETKPYVALIKYITEMKDGSIVLYVHWFYRPEDVESENAESLQPSDVRELFYSSHIDEVPAESIIHKCMVHFVPPDRRIPSASEHPGFIVQKVYDHISKRLFKLTDKNYEDNLQHEVDMLVQKTMCRLGDLPYFESGDHATGVEDQVNIGDHADDVDADRDNETSNRSDQLTSVEASESCYIMLANINAFTGNNVRDNWLEKLLEGMRFVLKNNDGSQSGGPTNMSQDNSPNTDLAVWTDAAVSATISLEKASYESVTSLRKYNQKMRQLCYNIKKNEKLTWRLLKGESEPLKILTMSPNELKEGLTEEEIEREKPEEDVLVEMTDAHCQICNEKKVCLLGIFLAGETNRYQLECTVCGKTWYASREEASRMHTPHAIFEDVEKILISPHHPTTAYSSSKTTVPTIHPINY